MESRRFRHSNPRSVAVRRLLLYIAEDGSRSCRVPRKVRLSFVQLPEKRAR
jgi:hypothetical protein